MQSTLSVKPGDDPCDDVALTPDVAHVVPSDEELSSVLHQAARHRLDAHASVAPDVTFAPTVQPADTIVRPVSAKDMLASEDRVAHHIAPPIDAMVRPAPANDSGRPEQRRPIGGRVARAVLALLSTLIIGLAAATWKSHGDGASKMIAGLVAQPVASSQHAQSEKSDVAAEPAPAAVRAEAAAAAPDQPAPSAQPVPGAPSSAAPASSDSALLLQAMARDLAALGQQVDNLKADMAQMKANQQQMSHNLAKDLTKPSEPTQRPKTSALPSRPVASQTRRPPQPIQSFASQPAAVPQPAVPQVATAPYRSAPQAAAAPPPLATAPYYAPPQRYLPPPPELPPQAAAEPPVDQEWVPRPPMPVR